MKLLKKFMTPLSDDSMKDDSMKDDSVKSLPEIHSDDDLRDAVKKNPNFNTTSELVLMPVMVLDIDVIYGCTYDDHTCHLLGVSDLDYISSLNDDMCYITGMPD